jgi:fatty acid synthase subunit alpha, fungi type
VKSTIKDEPIKDLLDNMHSSLVQRLIERRYGGDASKIPTIDYLGSGPVAIPREAVLPTSVKSEATETYISYMLDNPVPESSSWLEVLAGPQIGWLRALICSPIIVQGTSFIDNPIRRLLSPRSGQKIVVGLAGLLPSSMTVYGAARSYGTHKPDFKAVEIQYTATSKVIDVTILMYCKRGWLIDGARSPTRTCESTG